LNGGGNPDLSSEESNTYTMGVVIQPFSQHNFSLSVDWYRIKIDNAISQVIPQTLVDNCVLEAVGCEYVSLANKTPGRGSTL